ncbi:MAG: sulfite oxidase [Chloroflexota bacterium]|nr:sulfite oxidase [Chloroflexota bacterium]
MEPHRPSDPVEGALPSPGVGLSRRRLIARFAAVGFAAPAIATILASRPDLVALAQDATPAATPDPLAALVQTYGKDPRLIPYGTTNFGTPLGLIDGLIVPNELFFVRNNGPVAEIDPAAYRLTVNGLVDQPLELTLADLQAMPNTTMVAFLECSGDSRSRYQPQAEGTQWGNTGIGNAEWVGTSLKHVMAMAGVQDGAIDIVCQDGDFEEMQRGLPVGMAYEDDVMVVWQMNGEPLPALHGGPVRLLVPRWGGIASTKWLTSLEVIDTQFAGPFNSESYVIIDENEFVVRPVEEWPVKSAITRPEPDAQLTAGPNTVMGFAWSGYGGITRVEVSTDGGATYADAPIVEEAGPRSWVRFEVAWDAPAGPAALRSRAYDESGLVQPDTVPWNAKGYLMNAVYEVPVTVA